MATYDAAISVLIARAMKDRIGEILRVDRQDDPRISEAEVIRAALRIGLDSLGKRASTTRQRLYTQNAKA